MGKLLSIIGSSLLIVINCSINHSVSYIYIATLHESLLVFFPPFPCPTLSVKVYSSMQPLFIFHFSNQRTRTKHGMDNTNHNESTVIYAVHLSWLNDNTKSSLAGQTFFRRRALSLLV